MTLRVLALVMAIPLVACGGVAAPGTSEGADPRPSELAAVETPPPPRMGPDGPEPPDVEDLVAYGNRHRDVFGGLYIDPPGGSSVVMLFTRELETHQRAVNDLLPGTRVRQVRFTESELRALQEELSQSLFGQEGIELLTVSVDTVGNQVEVALKSDDPTLELKLEAAHGGMLDASVFPFPGPWANAESGDGWRLLATGDELGEAYTVRAARTASEWEGLWRAIGIDGERPAVDLDDDVVVSFGHGLSRSCPELRLDDVVIEGGVVYSVTSDPLAPRNCTDDLSAAGVFVIALDRDALPADGFTLRLCADCGFVEELEVRLP
jgi:hypothetical protein